MLPVIPRDNQQEEGEDLTLKGISRSAHVSIPIKPDPDSFKALLGYSGPFYNTEQLDGRVEILTGTLYEWPQETWKVSGLIRNQSCSTVHISAIEATLLDINGEVLQVARVTYSFADLRPGEPGPFTLEAPIQRGIVKAIQWQIESESISTSPSRTLDFSIYEDRHIGSIHSLFGRVRNIGTETTTDTRIIAAWLSREGKVIYIAQPKIRLISDPTKTLDSVNLEPDDFEEFVYTTDSSSIVSLLEGASVVLWGVSN